MTPAPTPFAGGTSVASSSRGTSTRRAARSVPRSVRSKSEAAYRAAVVAGAAPTQDGVEDAERAVRRARRDREALELAVARHRPVWVQAKGWALRAEAARHKATAREHQADIDALKSQSDALLRQVADRASDLQRALLEAGTLDRQADELAREAAAHARERA